MNILDYRFLREMTESMLSGKLSIAQYCSRIENHLNFELKSEDLTCKEQKEVRDLFSVVSWYTPIDEDRDANPTFKDEAAVKFQAQQFLKKIELPPGNRTLT